VILVTNLAEFLENINSRLPRVNGNNGVFEGTFRFNEPMADHTTFKVGGPADLWIRPQGDFPAYAALLLENAQAAGIPVFILGGGANLVVSDKGIRGIVLDTSGYCGPAESAAAGTVFFKAGTPVDEAVNEAAARGLSALEFLAGMPGSVGGALFMNARCYNREMSDVVSQAELLDRNTVLRMPLKKEAFDYKKSPFQGTDTLILGALFSVEPKDPAAIRAEMKEYRRDRENKGHYRFPCAGSVFKNNRSFGKPTGQILDELGLKGLSVGDAQVAPWHGNIIINRGRARAEDIKNLMEELKNRAAAETGLQLEPELIFAGEGFSGVVPGRK
jgi:UDP-N-acetylmuramate dehydrogenase